MIKKIMLFLVFSIVMCIPIIAQEKVEVSKEFVADATKCFELLVEYRTAIEKFTVERGKFESELKANQALILSLNELISVKDKIIKTNDDLLAVYQKIISVQNQLIDSLEKQINKPRPLWKKILTTIKEIALIAGGIAVGRVIGIP